MRVLIQSRMLKPNILLFDRFFDSCLIRRLRLKAVPYQYAHT